MVTLLAIFYAFACYQAVNVSLDMTTEIIPPGEFYDGIHIYCQGPKSESVVTVVIIPDENTPSLVWFDYMNLISTDYRACVYDRAGYGYSESGELPRNPNLMAEELYRILVQA